MKKGMFSMMNYYLPLKGIAAMHCSANTDLNGETQLSSSVFQEQVKLHFLQTRSVSSSVMTNTAGMTTEYSTSRVDATLRLSTLTKNLNQISTTQSDVTLFLRT